jgi:hypothetical protein
VSVSGTSISGECFRNWPKAQLTNLDVTETELTDAALPLIARLALSTLSIDGTKVTSKGILAAGFVGLNTLHVKTGQFTEAERKQIETTLLIHVAESAYDPSMSGPWF